MNVDELAKSIVRSGLIEAFQIDYVAGNIIIKSSAGVSAELYYALGIWDFYDKESAIERAVIAQMKGLAEEQTNKLEIPDLASGNTVLKDLAKQVTDKALKNIDNEFFGGLYGDKIAFTMSHGENIANLLDGNISGRQFMKNTVLGFMTTAVTMSALSILPISGGILGFLQVYGIKSKAKEKLKGILDSFIEDDDKRMVKIFNRVLTEELQGKLLTKYEIEFLSKKIIGNFNKEFIKEMLEQDKDTDREAFVRKHIHKSFGRAFRHRIFVKMPTEKDWQDGLARVKRRIETGEDLFSEMNSKRDKNLASWKEQQKKEEQATDLYMNFKFSQAVPLLKELADKGNVRARYMLIIINRFIRSLEENWKLDKKEYDTLNVELDADYIKDLQSKNIQAGDVCTIFHCITKENSKEFNPDKLIYLAENLYDVFAQYELAKYYFYYFFKDSREDSRKPGSLMFKYLHMAAEQDYFLAFYCLGIRYNKARIALFGRRAAENIFSYEPHDERVELLKKSIYWLRKAAEKGMLPWAVSGLCWSYYCMWMYELWDCFRFRKYFTKYHKWFEKNLTQDRKKFPELESLRLMNCWFGLD